MYGGYGGRKAQHDVPVRLGKGRTRTLSEWRRLGGRVGEKVVGIIIPKLILHALQVKDVEGFSQWRGGLVRWWEAFATCRESTFSDMF